MTAVAQPPALRDPGRLPRGPGLPPTRGLHSPVRWRRVLAALAILALLGAGIAWWAGRSSAPARLGNAVLTGTRGPGCLRLAVLGDVSGSMARYSAARESAVAQILDWAPSQLRADDELTVIDWGADAATALPTTPVAQFAGAQLATPAINSSSTDLEPAIDALRNQPSGRCHTMLVVVSDGLISRLSPWAVRNVLTEAAVTRVVLMRPATSLKYPAAWRQTLPYSSTVAVDGSKPNAVALLIGKLVASDTGQRLTRK